MTGKAARHDRPSTTGDPRGRQRQRKPRDHASRLDALEAHLQRRTTVTINKKAAQVSTSEAILLGLLQKAIAGKAGAVNALLQFMKFADERSSGSPKLVFPQNEYTRVTLKKGGRDD